MYATNAILIEQAVVPMTNCPRYCCVDRTSMVSCILVMSHFSSKQMAVLRETMVGNLWTLSLTPTRTFAFPHPHLIMSS